MDLPPTTPVGESDPAGEFRQLVAQLGQLAEKLERIEGRLEEGFEKLIGMAGPEEEPRPTDPASHGGRRCPPTALPQGNAAWEHALLGPDLAGHPNLTFKRQELLQGVLTGDPGARWLAGQLLVFQSAPAERLPQLLKEIGEAYYRWQPKKRSGTNPFEEALVAWLEKACDAAGISNTIEVVHPGERFDAARHNATSRGVEITEVYGWIVLRTGGKVYTKAAVGVK